MSNDGVNKRPMIFSSDTAFNQLADNGLVVTARRHKVEEGPVWVRRSRTGPKEFDARVYKVVRLEPPVNLTSIEEFSGFRSEEDWKSEIMDLNSGEVPDPLYLMAVEKE